MDYSEKMDTPAVHAHITMLQGIINRMAANSANCKTWAITVLTALLVFIADDNNCFNDIRICVIPSLLFFLLDSFYLGIERHVIEQQNKFLNLILKDDNYEYSLFRLEKQQNRICATLEAMFSFSIMPFYGLLLALIIIFNQVL